MTDTATEPGGPGSTTRFEWKGFPWWLVGIFATVAVIVFMIITNDTWRAAFDFIKNGLSVTLLLTLASFVLATVLGLFVALARLSKNTFLSNAAMYYIELIRGVPVLVTMFVIALVVIPSIWDFLGAGASPRQALRMWVALSIIYAAFIAEVFRAGIESVSSGQREAGKSVGLKNRHIMRFIVLPQAIRNIMPALGNDLIALLKDTSLASIFAVRELTQMTRLYTGRTFQFRVGFFVLTAFYLTLTVLLSLALRWYEKRIAIPN